MTNQTNLDNATVLYETIGKYVPSRTEMPEEYYDFIGKIISNIQESKDYMAYINAIHIMTGATLNILEEATSDEILDLFTSGLMEWRIIELVEFFREMGYQNA